MDAGICPINWDSARSLLPYGVYIEWMLEQSDALEDKAA